MLFDQLAGSIQNAHSQALGGGSLDNQIIVLVQKCIECVLHFANHFYLFMQSLFDWSGGALGFPQTVYFYEITVSWK